MADKKRIENPQGSPQPGIAVIGQFIKDLSFENPHSPAMLLKMKDKPNFDIGIDIKAQAVGEDVYEVSLLLNCRAQTPDKKDLFLVELVYCGIFKMQAIAKDHVESMLLVYCPSLLFPFARRVIADVTRDGGMPPLMLDPIDFASLYQQRKENAKKAAAQ